MYFNTPCSAHGDTEAGSSRSASRTSTNIPLCHRSLRVLGTPSDAFRTATSLRRREEEDRAVGPPKEGQGVMNRKENSNMGITENGGPEGIVTSPTNSTAVVFHRRGEPPWPTTTSGTACSLNSARKLTRFESLRSSPAEKYRLPTVLVSPSSIKEGERGKEGGGRRQTAAVSWPSTVRKEEIKRAMDLLVSRTAPTYVIEAIDSDSYPAVRRALERAARELRSAQRIVDAHLQNDKRANPSVSPPSFPYHTDSSFSRWVDAEGNSLLVRAVIGGQPPQHHHGGTAKANMSDTNGRKAGCRHLRTKSGVHVGGGPLPRQVASCSSCSSSSIPSRSVRHHRPVACLCDLVTAVSTPSSSTPSSPFPYYYYYSNTNNEEEEDCCVRQSREEEREERAKKAVPTTTCNIYEEVAASSIDGSHLIDIIDDDGNFLLDFDLGSAAFVVGGSYGSSPPMSTTAHVFSDSSTPSMSSSTAMAGIATAAVSTAIVSAVAQSVVNNAFTSARRRALVGLLDGGCSPFCVTNPSTNSSLLMEIMRLGPRREEEALYIMFRMACIRKQGSDVEKGKRTMEITCHRHHRTRAAALVREGDINWANYNAVTAFHIASDRGMAEAIKVLVGSFDINEVPLPHYKRSLLLLNQTVPVPSDDGLAKNKKSDPFAAKGLPRTLDVGNKENIVECSAANATPDSPSLHPLPFSYNSPTTCAPSSRFPRSNEQNADAQKTLQQNPSSSRVLLLREESPHPTAPTLTLSMPIHVKRATELKTNPNVRTYHGSSALYVAVKNGHTLAVKALLEAGADPDGRDYGGGGPIDSPSAGMGMDLGIGGGVADLDGRYPLHHAVVSGRAHLVELLVSYGASLDATTTRGGYGALQYAIDARRSWMVKLLLDLGANPNGAAPPQPPPTTSQPRGGGEKEGGFNGRVCCNPHHRGRYCPCELINPSPSPTPLYCAAERGMANVCKMLLDCGAEVEGGPFSSAPLPQAVEPIPPPKAASEGKTTTVIPSTATNTPVVATSAKCTPPSAGSSLTLISPSHHNSPFPPTLPATAARCPVSCFIAACLASPATSRCPIAISAFSGNDDVLQLLFSEIASFDGSRCADFPSLSSHSINTRTQIVHVGVGGGGGAKAGRSASALPSALTFYRAVALWCACLGGQTRRVEQLLECGEAAVSLSVLVAKLALLGSRLGTICTCPLYLLPANSTHETCKEEQARHNRKYNPLLEKDHVKPPSSCHSSAENTSSNACCCCLVSCPRVRVRGAFYTRVVPRGTTLSTLIRTLLSHGADLSGIVSMVLSEKNAQVLSESLTANTKNFTATTETVGEMEQASTPTQLKSLSTTRLRKLNAFLDRLLPPVAAELRKEGILSLTQ